MTTKKLYLICYDIQKDKARNKVAEILSENGKRINYSVFECFITETKLQKIKNEIETLCNKKTDYIKIYPICQTCYSKSLIIGNEAYSIQNHSIFI